MRTLIKRVQIVTGQRKEPYSADVLLAGRKISAIGELSGYRADRELDGQDKFLSPGFVDAECWADKSLLIFDRDWHRESLATGITSAIGGHQGWSLAPSGSGLSLGWLDDWSRRGTNHGGWRDLRDLYKQLDSRKSILPVNFFSLLGWNNLLTLTSGKFDKSLAYLLKEMNAFGSLGLSLPSNFNLSNGNRSWSKDRFTKFPFGLLEISEDSINYFSDSNKPSIRRKFLVYGNKDISRGIPQENGFYQLFSGYEYLFELAQMSESVFSSNRNKIGDDFWEKKVKKDIGEFVKKINNEQAYVFSLRNHDFMTNLFRRKIVDLAEDAGLTTLELWARFLKASGGRGVSSILPIENFIPVAQNKILYGSAQGLRRGLFLKYLEALVGSGLSLNEAVAQLTWLPASVFNLKNKGKVETGWDADLILWDSQKIYATIVSGQIVWLDK